MQTSETTTVRWSDILGPPIPFALWRRAQQAVDRHTRAAPPPAAVLRTTGFLRPDVAERVVEWFTAPPTAPSAAVRRSYRALERDTARLYGIVRRELGVRVRHTHAELDPDDSAEELCGRTPGCSSSATEPILTRTRTA